MTRPRKSHAEHTDRDGWPMCRPVHGTLLSPKIIVGALNATCKRCQRFLRIAALTPTTTHSHTTKELPMPGYSLMNCTPHDIHVAAAIFDREVLAWQPTRGQVIPTRFPVEMGLAAPEPVEMGENGPQCYRIRPSGIRLACDPETSGGPLGCFVRFDLSAEGEAEATRVERVFGQEMGSDMIVIASQISVTALDGRLYRPDGGTPIVAMWPVLAPESLRLPMGERWADKLATLVPTGL